MSDVQLFQYPNTGHQIRTIVIEGEPWFVAADVCTLLGYGGGGRNAVARLPERMKGVETVNTLGGPQQVTVLNEPGVYRLAMRSNLPSAEAFQDWLAEDVVPAIGRTGHYDIEKPMSELEMAQRYVAALQREQVLQAQVRELEPDAARARQTLDAGGLSLVRTVAKRFGIKETALRQFLYAERLLIRGGSSHNEPYARYVQSGHFEVKTTMVEVDPDRPPEAKNTTYVTPKGEALIWKRLFDAGYVTSPHMPALQPVLV